MDQDYGDGAGLSDTTVAVEASVWSSGMTADDATREEVMMVMLVTLVAIMLMTLWLTMMVRTVVVVVAMMKMMMVMV